jgi:predicted phosphoribosyltransferase
MYFTSRVEAGVKLAQELMKYRFEDTIVIALDQGGVRVGYQIAANLHSSLNQLLSQPINIEGENLQYATVMPGGTIAKNPDLSEQEQEFYYGEYQGEIDQAEREANTSINRVRGDGGELSPETLRDRTVILASDGLKAGNVVEAAVEFLKSVRIKRLVVAVPIVSVEAVDKIHVLADEMHILSVTPSYLGTSHYYQTDDQPTEDEVRAMLNSVILDWK